MSKFIYKAKKSPDEVLEGVIEADSKNIAANKLIESGYYPVWIEEESVRGSTSVVTGGLQPIAYRIKTRDIANFTRQLSGLLNSGLTLFNSLNLIESQTGSFYLKIIISNIKDSIKDGKSFSESLKNHPDIFSSLYVNLVKSGEEAGSLNEVLMNIADFLEKDEDIKAKIIAALAYPMLMAIVGFLTIFILIAFVVPKLVNMFIEMGEHLPLPTRILVSLSDFIKNYWLLLLIFIAGFIFLMKNSKTNTVTKHKIDQFKLKLPIFGDLIRHSELARFSRTFSMLLKNGVGVLHSLKITSDVIGNSVIKDWVESIYNDVRSGSTITASIKKKASFPIFILNMIAVGEEGGFMDRALLNIARNYETEVDRLMKIITTLLEPAFILIMGLVVGFIVVAMLLPVFEISLAAH